MKTTLFLPKTIKVGYQERSNTYTGKLAYVIYIDEKGKIRKEASWNSWRDNKIEPIDYENVPLEGFVLNKKVGDYVSSWNHRQAYVRVYDPRGFEFEITIENLLYILENTNSIKGKGLEGEFVYGWDGKELVLMPTDSPDYKEISEFNDKNHNQVKLKGKDLKVGGTYLSKSNEELVYLGRFDEWDYEYGGTYPYRKKNYFTKNKSYFFADKNKNIVNIKSLSAKIIAVISEECVDDYAELVESLEHSTSYSPVDDTKDKYIPYSLEQFKAEVISSGWSFDFYTQDESHQVIKFNKYNSIDEGFYREEKEEYERQGWMNSMFKDTRTIKVQLGSIEDVYEEFKPYYLQKYLKNGNEFKGRY